MQQTHQRPDSSEDSGTLLFKKSPQTSSQNQTHKFLLVWPHRKVVRVPLQGAHSTSGRCHILSQKFSAGGPDSGSTGPVSSQRCHPGDLRRRVTVPIYPTDCWDRDGSSESCPNSTTNNLCQQLQNMLRDFLRVVIRDNHFKFNDHYYDQKRGVAMGTRYAPPPLPISSWLPWKRVHWQSGRDLHLPCGSDFWMTSSCSGLPHRPDCRNSCAI